METEHEQQVPTITHVDSKSHPPRTCEQCGREFRARLRRTEHLELCSPCVEKWRQFCEFCPQIYRVTDPDQLPCGPDKLAAVLRWQYGSRGILLHGPTERGKTRAAWSLLRRLHFEGREIVAFNAVSFSHEVGYHFGPDGNAVRWVRRIYNAAIVFLDDVGKCRLTERGEAELFGLVETRTAQDRPIIATTNFVGNTLAATMHPETGAALVRRLREFCECIAF